jgi:hypothetical protein
MGAVLAMTAAVTRRAETERAWAKRAGIVAALAGAVVLLAGCGGLLPSGGGAGGANPAASLDRATLEAQGQPVLYATLPALGTSALMRPSGRNGDVVTWRTPDRVSLSLHAGVLVATRGLGHDLMSAETTRARAALSETAPGPASGAGYPRIYGYLDGEHRPQFRSFFCRVSGRDREVIEILGARHAVTRITESCSDPDLEFTNTHWRGPDGLAWKSRQWVGPDLGYLHTERLVR